MLGAACSREAPPRAPRVDSVAQSTPPATPTVIDWRGWDPSAGELLFVAPEDDPSIALVVRPDATAAAAVDTTWRARAGAADSVELLALDGTITRSTLSAIAAGAEAPACEEWPEARVSPAPRSWGVGFGPGRVRPLPITPLEAMGASDSSAAVATAARIAGAMPESGRSSLAGMPFTVERLHRITLATATSDSTAQRFGDTTLVAVTLFRRLAQEADPREERWFVLAERTGRARSAPWVVRYLEFDDAPEDEADAIALLGAVRLAGSAQPALVVARDGRNGLELRWITPRRDGQWVATWTSARARCRAE